MCCLITANAYSLYEKGLNFVDEREYIKALECFDDAISESKAEFEEAWLGKGNVHYFMKEFEKAVDSFDKVLQINSEVNDLMYFNSKFWMYRGASFNFLEKYEDAIKCFENAIKCFYNQNWYENKYQKGFDEVFLGMGYALYKIGKIDDARQYFAMGISDLAGKADTFAKQEYDKVVLEIEKKEGISLIQSTQDKTIKKKFETLYEENHNRLAENEYQKLEELYEKKSYQECIKNCNKILNYYLRDKHALTYKIESLLKIDEPKKALYFCGFRTYSHDEHRPWWTPTIRKCLDKLGVESEFPYNNARLTNPYYRFY